jgi:uncharacterized protein DUF3618
MGKGAIPVTQPGDQTTDDDIRPGDETSTEDDAAGGADAARIEADIAETRERMTGTVEAIGDRLDPANIIDDAKQTVRDATVGKVEDMTSTASEALSGAGSTVQDTGYGLLETVKQNPIPAALAGLGIAWLWTHRASGSRSDASRYRQPFDQSKWDTAYAGAGSQGGSWSSEPSTSEGITDKVSDVTDAVGRRVSGVGDAVGRLPDNVGGSAEGMGRQAQRMIEDSPLAAGAIALAVGAAISLALPATQVERRVLGPAGERVLDSVETGATDALQKAKESIPTS